MPRDHVAPFPLASNMRFAKGVLLLEDFSGANRWETISGVGDLAVERINTDYDTPTHCLSIKSRTTAAANLDLVTVGLPCTYPESDIITVRGKWKTAAPATASLITIDIRAYNGSTLVNPRLLWDLTNTRIQYYNAALSHTPIPEMDPGPALGVWDTWEITFNLKAAQYISALASGIRKDLSGIPIATSGVESDRKVLIYLTTLANASAPSTVLFDSIYAGEYTNI